MSNFFQGWFYFFFSIETHITCDFQRGDRPPVPILIQNCISISLHHCRSNVLTMVRFPVMLGRFPVLLSCRSHYIGQWVKESPYDLYQTAEAGVPGGTIFF